jgi:hypothetical protein
VKTCCSIQPFELLSNETVYTMTYFNLPQNQSQYVVGFLPLVDNAVHVHHFVVLLCTEPLVTYTELGAGVSVPPLSEDDNGALQQLVALP